MSFINASHTLNDADLNYTVTKKEFLAMIFAFENFHSYLIGSHIIILIILLLSIFFLRRMLNLDL